MFTCVANGKTYTADRPPAECVNSDIRELNRDGSVRRVIARPLTIESSARVRSKPRRSTRKRKGSWRSGGAIVRCWKPMPPSRNRSGRKKSLEGAEQIIRRSQERAKSLAEDRQRLDDESEFYKKREQPTA